MNEYNTIKYKTLYSNYAEWVELLSAHTIEQPNALGITPIIFHVIENQFSNCDIAYSTPELFWLDFANAFDTWAHSLQLKKNLLDTLYSIANITDLQAGDTLTISREGENHGTNSNDNKSADTPTQYGYTDDFIDKYVNAMAHDAGKQDTNYRNSDTHTTKHAILDTIKKINYIRGSINEEIIRVFAPLFMWFN